jgi:hypothetical protein
VNKYGLRTVNVYDHMIKESMTCTMKGIYMWNWKRVAIISQGTLSVMCRGCCDAVACGVACRGEMLGMQETDGCCGGSTLSSARRGERRG